MTDRLLGKIFEVFKLHFFAQTFYCTNIKVLYLRSRLIRLREITFEVRNVHCVLILSLQELTGTTTFTGDQKAGEDEDSSRFTSDIVKEKSSRHKLSKTSEKEE